MGMRSEVIGAAPDRKVRGMVRPVWAVSRRELDKPNREAENWGGGSAVSAWAEACTPGIPGCQEADHQCTVTAFPGPSIDQKPEPERLANREDNNGHEIACVARLLHQSHKQFVVHPSICSEILYRSIFAERSDYKKALGDMPDSGAYGFQHIHAQYRRIGPAPGARSAMRPWPKVTSRVPWRRP